MQLFLHLRVLVTKGRGLCTNLFNTTVQVVQSRDLRLIRILDNRRKFLSTFYSVSRDCSRAELSHLTTRLRIMIAHLSRT